MQKHINARQVNAALRYMNRKGAGWAPSQIRLMLKTMHMSAKNVWNSAGLYLYFALPLVPTPTTATTVMSYTKTTSHGRRRTAGRMSKHIW